jgi:hypothetical protein
MLIVLAINSFIHEILIGQDLTVVELLVMSDMGLALGLDPSLPFGFFLLDAGRHFELGTRRS